MSDIDDVYFTMETLDPSVSDSYKLKTRGLGQILRSFIPRGEGRLIQFIFPDIPLDVAFQEDGMGSPERDFATSNSGPCVEAQTALNLNKGGGHFELQQAAFDSQGSPFSNITSPCPSGMDENTLSPGTSYAADSPFPIDLQDLNLDPPSNQNSVTSMTPIPTAVQEVVVPQFDPPFHFMDEFCSTGMQS